MSLAENTTSIEPLRISHFSKHLFWDVDIKTLDADRHESYIISRVLQYGLYSDWRLLLVHYGIGRIVNVARRIKELDKKTAAFLALLGGISANEFACYTTMPSSPKHWNF